MTELRYAATPGVVAALLGSGVVVAALGWGQPTGGRLLLGAAAAALLGEGLRCALLRPTLRADAAGVEVVRGLTRERLPWGRVRAVRVFGTPGARPRRRARALELDLEDTVVLVPAYRLGRQLEDVVSELVARHPTYGS